MNGQALGSQPSLVYRAASICMYSITGSTVATLLALVYQLLREQGMWPWAGRVGGGGRGGKPIIFTMCRYSHNAMEALFQAEDVIYKEKLVRYFFHGEAFFHRVCS